MTTNESTHLDDAERLRDDAELTTANRAFLMGVSIIAHLRSAATPSEGEKERKATAPVIEAGELPDVLPAGTRVKFGDCPWVLTEPSKRRDSDWFMGMARNDLFGGPATEIMFRWKSIDRSTLPDARGGESGVAFGESIPGMRELERVFRTAKDSQDPVVLGLCAVAHYVVNWERRRAKALARSAAAPGARCATE